jgi:DNA-binding GntR family transcriptional regulator
MEQNSTNMQAAAPTSAGARGAGMAPELLSERAYRIIEEMIVTLQLRPNAVITETRLAADLGIGRTPVREALQRLSREGLVQLIRSRGLVVSEIDVKGQLRVLEARRNLEILIARLATQRATPAQLERFSSLAVEFREIASQEDEYRFLRHDREFNELLLDAAHNLYCARMMSTIQGLSRRFFFRYKESLDLATTANQHADIAEAIARGDADRAAQAVEVLISYNEDFAYKSLKLP